LWAAARYDLGLSPDEFWALTPAQFRALYDRHILALEEADVRAALICTVMANIHRGKNRKPFRVEDFVPDRRGKRKAPRQQTWEEQLALVKQWHKILGGK